MSAVSEQIVREYFEQLGFLVRELRKSVARGDARRSAASADFAVLNPASTGNPGDLPFELRGEFVSRIRQAAVLVLGWHTTRIYARTVGRRSEIGKFVDRVASSRSGYDPSAEGTLKLIVAPGLPTGQAGERAVAALRERGVDGVLPFDRLLGELVVRVEVNRNYTRSDLLQTLRLLKIYRLLRDPQMELFAKRRGRR